ncbi:Ubiquitin-conjugating enzyme E2 4 [Sarracenia purpurea var. burkii]
MSPLFWRMDYLWVFVTKLFRLDVVSLHLITCLISANHSCSALTLLNSKLNNVGIENIDAVLLNHPEFCEKYAKPEDVGAGPEENSSDDEELSEGEYESSDEAMVGPVDP